jgi:quercetin dioxygenase-like cupin family protein
MPSPESLASGGGGGGAVRADLAVPRILGDFEALAGDLAGSPGALWKLTEPGRQLDANLVHLPPGQHVGTHAEPDLDVLLLVVAGDGILGTTGHALRLAKGTIAWLPHGSARSLAAGDDGLSYLTVHQRRPGMRVKSRQEATGADPG